MITGPLDDVRLYDFYARSPLLFNTLALNALPIAEMDQPIHPASELGRRSVQASAAVTPTHLEFGRPTPAESFRHAGPSPAARGAQVRPRPISFPLMGQNVPSANSAMLIAALTERHVAPPGLSALYERTAQAGSASRIVVVA